MRRTRVAAARARSGQGDGDHRRRLQLPRTDQANYWARGVAPGASAKYGANALRTAHSTASMLVRLGGGNAASRGQVDCKTAQPVAAFVMFAGHGREAGATVRIGRSL